MYASTSLLSSSPSTIPPNIFHHNFGQKKPVFGRLKTSWCYIIMYQIKCWVATLISDGGDVDLDEEEVHVDWDEEGDE